MNRRQLLRLAALSPALPSFVLRSAQALDQKNAKRGSDNGNILIVVRLKGGNDGLNAVVPIRDDAYYKGRPTIAIQNKTTLAVKGGDLGLNPALADFHWLIEQGQASIVTNVGYPNPSRSHIRATEIWETGSVAGDAPQQGWLGRVLDQSPEIGSVGGV